MYVLKVILKRWVLRACLNDGSVKACWMWLGRELQREDAATERAAQLVGSFTAQCGKLSGLEKEAASHLKQLR